MPERDKNEDEGSVWRGLARMEAEVQDPDEDETSLYDSSRMLKAALAAQRGEALDPPDDNPTSVRTPAEVARMRRPAEEGRDGPTSESRPKQSEASVPKGGVKSATDEVEGGKAEELPIEIIAERDADRVPVKRQRPPKPQSNTALWFFVMLLVLVAAALAYMRWRGIPLPIR